MTWFREKRFNTPWSSEQSSQARCLGVQRADSWDSCFESTETYFIQWLDQIYQPTWSVPWDGLGTLVKNSPCHKMETFYGCMSFCSSQILSASWMAWEKTFPASRRTATSLPTGWSVSALKARCTFWHNQFSQIREPLLFEQSWEYSLSANCNRERVNTSRLYALNSKTSLATAPSPNKTSRRHLLACRFSSSRTEYIRNQLTMMRIGGSCGGTTAHQRGQTFSQSTLLRLFPCLKTSLPRPRVSLLPREKALRTTIPRTGRLGCRMIRQWLGFGLLSTPTLGGSKCPAMIFGGWGGLTQKESVISCHTTNSTNRMIWHSYAIRFFGVVVNILTFLQVKFESSCDSRARYRGKEINFLLKI